MGYNSRQSVYDLRSKVLNKFSIALFGITALHTKAYGHWANHSSAWDWTNSGHTWGYDFIFHQNLFYQ